MSFSFHPGAEEEFVAAVAHYDDQSSGLGLSFAREVLSVIRSTSERPRLWPEIESEVRRCLIRRFPYGVLYSVEPHGIFVLAVMHLHRAPDYWKHRLTD